MRPRSEWVLLALACALLFVAWHNRVDRVVARTIDPKVPVGLRLRP